MTAIVVPDRTTFYERFRNTGSSEASKRLQHFFENTVAELRERSFVWNHTQPAKESLVETYEECGTNNWDGYGAAAVTETAFEEALKLLSLLPSWFPTPEIVPESSGEIGLEWNRGKDHIFAASVRGEGIITYAGLMGRGNKIHGTEIFDDAVPAVLITSIRRLYP